MYILCEYSAKKSFFPGGKKLRPSFFFALWSGNVSKFELFLEKLSTYALFKEKLQKFALFPEYSPRIN